MRKWSGIATVLLFAFGAGLIPATATAQVVLGQLIPPVDKGADRPADGIYVTPSLSIGELYDDNLFFSSTNRKQDFFTRVSPGIQAGYQSTPLTVMGGYTSDSEFYSRHQELDTWQMRQRALAEIKVMPTSLLTLSTKGTYAQTRAPWEFNTFSGVALRRVRAERLALDSSLAYRLDARTKATGEFDFSRDRMEGALSINSYIARLAVEQEVTGTDTLTPGYVGRRFRFFGAGTVTSHAPTLRWRHEISPLTSVTLSAGPRFTEGTLDDRPEALLSIQHKLKRGTASFVYSNVQTTIVGQAGSVNVDSVGVTFTYELDQHLLVAFAPATLWVRGNAISSTMYVSNVELTYQLTKELALKGSHQYSLMQGNFSPATGPGGDMVAIPHNLFWFRLVLNIPTRLN